MPDYDQADLWVLIKQLYEDPDADINGGDMVQAMGFAAKGDWANACIDLEIMISQQ